MSAVANAGAAEFEFWCCYETYIHFSFIVLFPSFFFFSLFSLFSLFVSLPGPCPEGTSDLLQLALNRRETAGNGLGLKTNSKSPNCHALLAVHKPFGSLRPPHISVSCHKCICLAFSCSSGWKPDFDYCNHNINVCFSHRILT